MERETCTVCCRSAASPYRRFEPTGKVYEGCVASFHDGQLVEIDDTLPGIVESVIDDVKEELLRYLEANPDTGKTPDMGNDLDYSGSIHEILDGSVPAYTSEINDIFYLHGSDVEGAFDKEKNMNYGGWPCGDWRMPAIYCYIEQRVNEWYFGNADEIFEGWREKQEAKQTSACA